MTRDDRRFVEVARDDAIRADSREEKEDRGSGGSVAGDDKKNPTLRISIIRAISIVTIVSHR